MRPAIGSAQETASGSRPIISVVIPTRNRPDSLERTLRALGRQSRPPDEVIIVDASDRPPDGEALRAANPSLPLLVLRSDPGVCSQRNLGIRRASGSHVLLCDDDIEPPAEYLERLIEHLAAHPATGAVTGAILEPGASGELRPAFPRPSLRRLFFAFIFHLTVWGDVEAVDAGRVGAAPLRLLKRWYRRRGNRWSPAGWPLVTQVEQPAMRTAIYTLMATLVRRDWLLASPYDERLGPYGIGDNYGVAIGFPGERSIDVLVDLPVLHHREATNRLDATKADYRRVLALDYFMRTSDRFSRLNTACLAWSLVGKAILLAIAGRGDRALRTLRALRVVATGRNPLLRDARRAAAARVPSSAGETRRS